MPKKAYDDAVELDPLGNISGSGEYDVEVRNLDRDVDAWLYWDEGAGGIGDFEHQCYMRPITAGSLARTSHFWCIANIVEDVYFWAVNSSQAIECNYAFKSANPNTFALINRETGESTEWDNGGAGVAQDATYHFTFDRPTATTVRARIYSDEARTTLLATLSVTVDAGRSWRYLFAVNSVNNGTTGREVSFDCGDYFVADPPTTTTTTTAAPGPTTTAAPGPAYGVEVDVYVNDALAPDLVVRTIRASYVRPWQAELEWPGRHDDPPDVRLWDEVRIEDDAGNVRFDGFLTGIEPGGVDSEGVRYTASDRRFILENEPVRINGRGYYLW
ncbi:MAG: hypothetical protein GXY85_03510, partial [Candidatus Brocadiaceae bacterium]|nr:hypothetical protein [Candidatus Brocadiaceae bacterium]